MADTKPATAESTPELGMNLYQKLAAITGEVGAVAKGGRNTQQNFDFIEYAAVAGNLRGLFSKYGVIIVPRMQQTAKQRREVSGKAVSVLIDFSFTVVNADAPEDKFTVTWTGEAIDYGDKAANKAATSALKYYLMRQFNISEKGEDPDAHSPERPTTPNWVMPKAISDEIWATANLLSIPEEKTEARIAQITSVAEAKEALAKLKALLDEGSKKEGKEE